MDEVTQTKIIDTKEKLKKVNTTLDSYQSKTINDIDDEYER